MTRVSSKPNLTTDETVGTSFDSEWAEQSVMSKLTWGHGTPTGINVRITCATKYYQQGLFVSKLGQVSKKVILEFTIVSLIYGNN